MELIQQGVKAYSKPASLHWPSCQHDMQPGIQLSARRSHQQQGVSPCSSLPQVQSEAWLHPGSILEGLQLLNWLAPTLMTASAAALPRAEMRS